jgi:hypothetical protein
MKPSTHRTRFKGIADGEPVNPFREGAVDSMKAALGEALIDLEPDRSRQFSLLLIKAVKVVRSEFQSCCNRSLHCFEFRCF